MRVPDLVLRSIGFVAEMLGSGDALRDGADPVASAFFVSFPSERVKTARFTYAVTAKHVFTHGTPNVPTVVIVNKRGGGVGSLPIPAGWFYHPDSAVDIAVAPVALEESIEISAFEAEDFFDASRNPENIGPGDEVFFAGLFTAAPGVERIIPMVRHGNIAMLPGEQIQTSAGYADIYLVEARSIGGLSGSPVFARETVILPMSRGDEDHGFRGGTKVMMQGLGVFKLLGLVQGHWDVDESKINQAYFVHDPKRGVNMGIAKVVPAFKILEALNIPELVAMRTAAEMKVLAQHTTSMDGR